MTPTLTGLILIGVIVIITLYYAWLDHHYVFYDENGRQCRLLNTPEDVYKALTEKKVWHFANRPRLFDYLDKYGKYPVGNHVMRKVSKGEYKDELGNSWWLHKDYCSKQWIAERHGVAPKANPYIDSMEACRPAVPFHGFRGGEDNY